ncbi:MAG: hypothetical protein QF805_09385, partial [Pirellulaceae bacterium]|nr:hypothetical protein [Pirellulaceae bacterium]
KNPTTAKKDEEKKKKKLPDFQVGPMKTQPYDGGILQNAVKPGHWIATIQEMKANNFEMLADLRSASVDENARPIMIEKTNYQMVSSRLAALPKGQTKAFEVTYFVPRRNQKGKRAWLQSQLRARHGGRELVGGMQPTSPMPDYQYFFVVLSQEPDRYAYIRRFDSVMPPSNDLDEFDDIVYYRIVRPKPDGKTTPLPTNALTWTSIAVLLWDEMDPNELSPLQQDALLDWLHFGGQIVVSGPSALDLLRGSFLDEFLPAEKVKSVDLQQADFDDLNTYWSLRLKRNGEHQILDVKEKPLVGVELKVRSRGEFVKGAGSLVAETMVGRGRIVVSAFPLKARKVVNWGSYDSFFHNCLLRRRPREFVKTADESVKMMDASYKTVHERSPMHVTNSRFFSRDIAAKLADIRSANTVIPNTPGAPGDVWHYGGHVPTPESGVGGWSDFSGAAHAARHALKQAAGISIPQAGFVFKVILIYLVVLVPVNWVVFRLLGRVEWAWVAAPIIAIGGSVAVVRLAQLDIGFARSRTEAAVLEMYGGYRRGHLTRYTALYTSLSTTYDFIFDDDTAVAQPFAADANHVRRTHDSTYTVRFRRTKDTRLSGFVVPSNTTGMVHSEQMYAVEGPFVFRGDETKGFQLENNTEFPVRDAAVLRCLDDGRYAIGYLGELKAKLTQPVKFDAVVDRTSPEVVTQWKNSLVMGKGRSQEGEVSLHEFGELATRTLLMKPGDVRLVGWTDQDLKGTTISPAASQTHLRTLVLVHLREGDLQIPKPDLNLHADLDDRRVLTDDDVTGSESE